MPGIQQWQHIYTHELTGIYDAGEAQVIARWVLEDVMMMDRIGLIIHALQEPGTMQEVRLYQILERLKRHEPLQYILGYTWFCGHRFRVNEHVLIPRRETEELVALIVQQAGHRPVIADMGTGSGCIAISLAKEIPGSKVFAADISPDALQTAADNADDLQAPVKFIQMDMLDEAAWYQIPSLDILVSNPPYIPLQEKQSMKPYVTGFEPHQALFVPDNDPLLFYRMLGYIGLRKLVAGGHLYAEIHEDYGSEVAALWKEQGYQAVQIVKDMQGKERIVHASN